MSHECANCHYLVPASARVCPTCGHDQPPARVEGAAPQGPHRGYWLATAILGLALLGGPLIFVITSGGTSEALYRVGVGGYSDKAKAVYYESCDGAPQDFCDCLLEETQKRVSEDEFLEANAKLLAGDRDIPDELIDATRACGDR